MSANFSHTVRSLKADGTGRRTAVLALTAPLLAWASWFFLGRVTVYEVSETARLEVQSAAHAVAAPVEGRIVENRLAIGRTVRADEVLVVLESEAERRALDERRYRISGLSARRQALQNEIRAEQDVLAVQRGARSVALEEARAHLSEAEARARFTEQQLETLEALSSRSASSSDEVRKSRAEVEARRATAKALRHALARLEKDRLAQEGDRRARIARLEREVVELDGEAAAEEAAVRRLEYAIEVRTIRSPISGRVGAVSEFRAGSVVRAAERLGSIVPPGKPRAVALFPAAAAGRLRPGQSARLRLDGFPWTQYGTLAATVADIGNEASGGLIRVEFTLAPDPASPLPVEHGLPASVEVAVEGVSPAILVLRAAGQFLTPKQQ